MKASIIIVVVLALIQVSCSVSTVNEPQSDYARDNALKRQLMFGHDNGFYDSLQTVTDSVSSSYLEYLFTYMPLSDFADYDFDFYRTQVSYAVQARRTFSWAADVPEELFLHYVLPPRVNNENMDTARVLIFNELRNRFSGQTYTAAEAALEVNHWCHERMNYRPTDERTISPLGAMLSAFGRCGEESTFVVTALRSVGIPARQVYTPRWAHTDDNHAWVEVWANHAWHYLGACEPAATLNTGWFDVAASRAMLVHAKEFGNSNKDKCLRHTLNFNWINVLPTYTTTRQVNVMVVDTQQQPVSGADVEFRLFNYAEMFPLFKTTTDSDGSASFTTGYGTLDVLVSYAGRMSVTTVFPHDTALVRVVVGGAELLPPEHVVYVPPEAAAARPVDTVAEASNNRRLQAEDDIRMAYERTFFTAARAAAFVDSLHYAPSTAAFLVKSRGNWPELTDFLRRSAKKRLQSEAALLLSVLPEKDLRDTKADILSEHLEYALQQRDTSLPDDIFASYVLCPRVHFEVLKPYRKQLLSQLSASQLSAFKADPKALVDYVASQVQTAVATDDTTISADDLNGYNVSLSPAGTDKLKLCDKQSYKIYLAAFCRSVGLPARIEAATGAVQIYHNSRWHDYLLTADTTALTRGKILLHNGDASRELKYRVHFALAQLTDGHVQTVDLGWEVPIAAFEQGIELPVGRYMLLTALRRDDGSVVVDRQYFTLTDSVPVNLTVTLPSSVLRPQERPAFVHGQLADKEMNIINTRDLMAAGKSLALCWLAPNEEPSKHVVRDLSRMSRNLTDNNIEVIYLVDKSNFIPQNYGFQPDIKFCYDADLQLLKANDLKQNFKSGIIFPQVMLIGSSGDVKFSTSGYVIGVGELLLGAK